VSDERSERRKTERRDKFAELERTLPHNLEAERSVLGSILMHDDSYVHASRYVTSASFFRVAHRRIYESMSRLLERPGGSADLITVKEDLGKRGELDDVGGPAYIASLTDGVPRSLNIAEYARIVAEKALLRAIIYAANKMLTDAYAAEDPASEILNQADQAVVQLQHGASTGRMQSLAASSGDLLERLEYRVSRQGQLTGVDVGFDSINQLTLGWQPGELIVIAARPSIGKTAFTLNTAMAAALSKRPDDSARHVAIFSLEMRRQQLEDRMLSSLSGVPATAIMGGWIYDPQWEPLTQAIGTLHELQIHIDDASRRSAWDIRSECRRLRTEHGLDLVIVDYIQLMTGTLSRKGATRNEEVTDISRTLKVLSDELSVPIIVLSQLNRGAEGRPDPRPKLTDLRESGALEQDADIVAFLHRRHHRESGLTEFILEKQRNGSGGTCNLTFDRDIQRFADAGIPPAESPPPEPTAEEKAAAKTRAIIANRIRKHR
jgi:replicative DNA helicase